MADGLLEQLQINILFDEVKLRETVRFSEGHILGQFENNFEKLAPHALVTQVISPLGVLCCQPLIYMWV